MKIENNIYQNGFECRFANRRITCWKIEQSYYIKFIQFTNEDMTHHEKYFDKLIKTKSGYLTIKIIKISEEAFSVIVSTGFHYLNATDRWSIPKPASVDKT